MSRNAEFLLYIAVMTALQLAAAALFWRLLRRRYGGDGASMAAQAAVIVPCKGVPPGLARNVAAILKQDSPPLEWVFVVPEDDGGAAGVIGEAIAGEPRARLLRSSRRPSSCSGKIADLLFALENVPAETEFLVFADADQTVRPDWLRRLLAPLAEPGPAVVTSCSLYVCVDGGFWSFLRMVWFGAVLPWAALAGCAIGHAMALRRVDFDRLGVAAAWQKAVLEDYTVTLLARAAKVPVRFCAEAISSNTEPCDARSYWALLNKWVFFLRVHDPAVWLAACAAVLAHVWIVYWCLRPPLTPWLPLLLAAGDAAAVAAIFAAFAREVPGRLNDAGPLLSLRAAVATPLIWGTYAVNIAASAFGRTLRWGSRTYVIRGPRDVEVVG